MKDRFFREGEFATESEKEVGKHLDETLNREWFIVSNKRVPNVTEIDFLLISPHNVYVVEEKNWAGELASVEGRERVVVRDPSGPFESSDPVKKLYRQIQKIQDVVRSAISEGNGEWNTFGRLLFSNREFGLDTSNYKPPKDMGMIRVLRWDDCVEKLESHDKKHAKSGFHEKYQQRVLDVFRAFDNRTGVPDRFDRMETSSVDPNEGRPFWKALVKTETQDQGRRVILSWHPRSLNTDRRVAIEAPVIRSAYALRKLTGTLRAPTGWEYERSFEDGFSYALSTVPPSPTLQMLIESGDRPSAKRIFRVIGDALEALRGIHERGVIHNGLTPRSIQIDSSDRVTFSCFEYAETRGETEKIPSTKPEGMERRYLAPEFPLREETIGDAKCDCYSLAASLYHWVYGEAPSVPLNVRERLASSRPDLKMEYWVALEKIFLEILSEDSARRPDAEKALEFARSEARFEVKRLFHIQGRFFNCQSKVECQDVFNRYAVLAGKESIGPQTEPIRYNPPPEFVSDKYSGIVLVGYRPGTAEPGRNEGANKELCGLVGAFQDNPSTEAALRLNKRAKEFSIYYKGTSNIFNILAMKLDPEEVAILNVFKCRTPRHDLTAIPPYRYCASRYLAEQLKVLRPVAVIYAVRFLLEFDEEIFAATSLPRELRWGATHVLEDLSEKNRGLDEGACEPIVKFIKSCREKRKFLIDDVRFPE